MIAHFTLFLEFNSNAFSFRGSITQLNFTHFSLKKSHLFIPFLFFFLLLFFFLFFDFLLSSSCCLYLYVYSYIVVAADCSHTPHNKLLILKKKKKNIGLIMCTQTLELQYVYRPQYVVYKIDQFVLEILLNSLVLLNIRMCFYLISET